MYQKILVPMALDHDVSPHTTELARALCAQGGEIIALHVYETPQGSVSAFLDETVVKEGFDKARHVLDQKLSGLTDISGEIAKGHSARTIIEYAKIHQIDCIVIGSHKPGLSDYFLGSTASRVVRHAPCAVHVHRSS
jgi:nucleotide-binding universal stress UspA family protein